MEIAYVAGILDGEGCVSIAWRLKKYITPIIQVANTNLLILELLQKQFGGSIIIRKEIRLNRKQIWTWIICGNLAITLLKETYPFLIIKKQQAEIVLGINRCCIKQDTRGRLVRRMTQAIINDNIKRVEAIRLLNKRGIMPIINTSLEA